MGKNRVLMKAEQSATASRINAAITEWVTDTSADDYMIGTEKDDWIICYGGNDTLEGLGGNDDLWGGSGRDTVSYWHAVRVDLSKRVAYSLDGAEGTDKLLDIESVEASDEDDILIGDNADNDLIGFGGNDSLEGGKGADYLSGGQGNDTLVAGAGADTLYGGSGDDLYRVDAASDTVFEGVESGTDTLYASGLGTYALAENVERLILTGQGKSSATGNAQDNSLTGNAANNTLKGMGGNDALNGGGGRDTLKGDAGNDVLNGGGDRDTLEGGAGNDTFVFSTALGASGKNIDTINDFSATDDVIHLDNDVFKAFSAENVTLGQEAFYAGWSAYQGHDADDRIIYNTISGALYYDADGSGAGAAVRFADLGFPTHPTITYQDFFIVA